MLKVFKRVALFVIIWVIAYNFYSLIVTPVQMEYSSFLPSGMEVSFSLNALIGTFAGIFMGIVFSLFDLLTSRFYHKKSSFGLEVLIRIMVYCFSILIVFVMGFVSYLLISQKGPETSFSVLVIRYFSLFSFSILMCILLGFIIQISRHIGENNLLSLFIGKYYKPREEERIFMFLDMRSSTTIAEKLGHNLFSELIQDCFFDLNSIINKYKAEIYKYVGDEVILVWDIKNGKHRNNCVGIFMEFMKIIDEKKEYYRKKYGVLPQFKAGLNSGPVTVIEVGSVKREIAFYGDVLNTAARIQSVCNEYGNDILISETVADMLKSGGDGVKLEFIGAITLRGKDKEIKIYSAAPGHDPDSAGSAGI